MIKRLLRFVLLLHPAVYFLLSGVCIFMLWVGDFAVIPGRKNDFGNVVIRDVSIVLTVMFFLLGLFADFRRNR